MDQIWGGNLLEKGFAKDHLYPETLTVGNTEQSKIEQEVIWEKQNARKGT